ncbi:hypothetical protein SFR_4600 [Streptomyces sp. FR-008]|nr:hypothetical protein SFR_4600 [Streptomyces sp. FR-008]
MRWLLRSLRAHGHQDGAKREVDRAGERRGAAGEI